MTKQEVLQRVEEDQRVRDRKNTGRDDYDFVPDDGMSFEVPAQYRSKPLRAAHRLSVNPAPPAIELGCSCGWSVMLGVSDSAEAAWRLHLELNRGN